MQNDALLQETELRYPANGSMLTGADQLNPGFAIAKGSPMKSVRVTSSSAPADRESHPDDNRPAVLIRTSTLESCQEKPSLWGPFEGAQ
jgi:hypothetical protein